MHLKDRLLKPEAPMASSFSASGDDLDLQWLLRTLSRRKWSILLPALMAAVIAALLVMRVPSTYDGQAEVLIDTRQSNVADIDAVLTNAISDDEALASQVRVIQSRGLAYKVVEELGLVRDPEFNGALKPPGAMQQATGWVREQLQRWGLVSPPTPPTPEEAAEQEMTETVDAFLDALDVELVARSRVIAIGFTSEDPRRAAEVANKVAELYVLEELDAKYEATRRATQWLTGKIAELRRTVAEAEQSVERFRSQAGLLQGTGGTLISQQISDLNSQLIVVRAARAEADARLAQVRQLIRTAGGADGAADVLRSPIIQQLMEQETVVKRKVAELSNDYGDRHPRMISARAELTDIQAKMQREVGKVVAALENEVNVARAREQALDRNLDQLKARLSQSNTAEVQLRALEREAEASRALLESFLGRFEQTSAQLDASINDSGARIISRADTPEQPSYPPRKLVIAVAFIAGALFSAVVVLGLEQMERGFRSGEQVEKATGLRALGLVPMVRASGSGKTPAGYMLRHPSSMFGEAIRSLYTSILLSPGEAAPHTLLVTSSQPKEGKTTISVSLARMRAMAGHSTVIVEADLRRPTLHRAVGGSKHPGLVEVLTGEATLDDVLVKDEASGMWMLSAGKPTLDPTELLGSPQMKEVLAELARRFQLVVVDSPPVVAVADARLLAPQVDACVLVVRWSRTDRDVVGLAVKQLQESGAKLTGAVLSLVDSRKHAQYGYADSAYYYGPVRRYYSS